MLTMMASLPNKVLVILLASLLMAYTAAAQFTTTAHDARSGAMGGSLLYSPETRSVSLGYRQGYMLNELAGQLRAHNEYLQYATFYGIPAGICYIAGCFSVYLHGLKHRKELDLYTVTCLVTAFSYLASAFVGNTKMLTTGLFFCILGLGFSVEKQDVPDKET